MSEYLDPKELEMLRRWSTCAISNGIELFNIRPRNEGFMLPEIKCVFPELRPMIGYAVTAVISTSSSGGHQIPMQELWKETLKTPEPRVVVIHDIDHPVVGSFWGEVRTNIFKSLRCEGIVTDGAVRDLDEVREIGFHFFSSCVSVSHAYNHLLEVGIPVKVGGLVVKPGDLVMGDQHGVISIPLEMARDISEAVQLIEDRERAIITFCKSREFTLDGLVERYMAPRPTWPPR